jgi:plastocyanin
MKVRGLVISVITVIACGAAIGTVLVWGRGDAAPSLRLAGGSAWFASRSEGAVALLDGATGTRIAKVDHVADANAPVTVEQAGSDALVVNPEAGTVASVDAATWTPGSPLHVGAPGDQRLAVVTATTAATAAWVVSQGATIVQQLDPTTMTLLGMPATLPSAVSGTAVADDGRLWVAAESGEVRSYRNSEQESAATVGPAGRTALVLVDQQPVAVDAVGHATVLNPSRGTPDRTQCLDVPADPPPAVAGSDDGSSWLLAVAPSTGTLVVSDLARGTCQPIALGATGSSRYGAPVERDRLVYVPDFVAGQVIVVDPAAPTGRQIKAHVDLGLANTRLDLFVHDQHVWFDEVDGDKAGVITDNLQVRVTSKSGTGQNGDAPQPSTSGPGAAAAAGGSSPTAGSSGPATAASSAGGSSAGGTGTGAATETGAVTTTVPSGGGSPPAPPPATPPPAGAGSVVASFTFSPNPAKPGQPVTFTDTSTGTHTVAQWSAPDGQPQSATTAGFTTTFDQSGSFPVTLTVTASDGTGKTATNMVTVTTSRVVPDLAGQSTTQAAATLAGAGLKLGQQKGLVASAIPAGTIVSSNPPAGTTLPDGSTVDYRASAGAGHVVTLATGVGGATAAAADGGGNIFLAQPTANQVKKVAPDGTVTVFAGTGVAGPASASAVRATTATLSSPTGVAADSSGNVYIADNGNHVIRKVDAGGMISTFAGTGTAGLDFGSQVFLDLTFDQSGNVIVVVADTGGGATTLGVRRITPAGQGSIVGNLTLGTGTFNANEVSLVFSGPDSAYWLDGPADKILRKSTFSTLGGNTTVVGSQSGANPPPNTGDGGPGTSAGISSAHSLRADANGVLYFADTGDNRIRSYDPGQDKVAGVVGSSSGAAGSGGGNGEAGANTPLNAPSALAVGNGIVTIVDAGNQRILQMAL